MRYSLKDRVVLLTGASSGIGYAMAGQLASEAKILVLVARRRARLEALADELRSAHPGLECVVAPCDLSDAEATEALLADLLPRLGRVDVLINNAGFGDIGLFENAEPDKLSRMIAVNCVALTRLCALLSPSMIAAGEGAILNISSGFGLTFTPGVAVYAGTKHYVTAFTEALRQELRGHGIVVTQSCPGPVATEFESVSGNPTGQPIPGLLVISAESCARASLKGLTKGRALVMPGVVAPLFMNIGRLVPRVLWRPMSGWIARYLRKLGGPSAVETRAKG
jgi:uncharacterized protein